MPSLATGRAQAVGVSDLPTAKEIRLDRIEPDPEQPRRTFDEAKLAELAESIRQEGILQAIAVRYDHEADRYVILHGERRWRASKLAGLPAIRRWCEMFQQTAGLSSSSWRTSSETTSTPSIGRLRCGR
jgi:hypothetical protein